MKPFGPAVWCLVGFVFVCSKLWAASPAGQYVVNADAGVVVDTMSGLTWQRGHSDAGMQWGLVEGYCKGVNVAGFTDWRVPRKLELETLIDRERVAPAIDLAAFPNVAPDDIFWTSTPYAGLSGAAWGVRFGTGVSSNYGPAVNGLVRCVR